MGHGTGGFAHTGGNDRSRNCHVAGMRDQLWLGPLDPAALLAARTYEAPIDLTLRIVGSASGWSAPTVTVRLRSRPGEPAEVIVLDQSSSDAPGTPSAGRSRGGAAERTGTDGVERVDRLNPARRATRARPHL